ncbi:low-specificity L-threonine aldolase [Phaeobacter sp. HF9A]|uniref:low-specificity L-threonine aldolase n=1 Tax=Phaeobacter sp. HF9A TaxID=2721561 RepID=UPI001431E800|nr:low-specificity L-threonine aldolase [Phaeobacter sp. HF9A]NIZ14673.1 low-specificity L-threonine aldolase [Phaeobacter sp. HF9A]
MSQYAQTPGANLANVICDLRSDTVTRPDAGMRAAMAAAEVGDDVYGEDPGVNRLEQSLAERAGKEAGLFVPSGTQSNFIAMLSHCGRGEEVITGRSYHVYKYEAGGASALGGVVMDPQAVAEDGGLRPEDITAAIKADDSHHPVSRLLSLENTHNGKVISLARMDACVAAARAAGLATHLDGARVFNAVSALGCELADVAELFDTVSICLSKGLGAPVGSVLVGPSAFITRARRWRKMVGGGMRQAGILAAAGLYALEHNVAGLAQDHARAAALADMLRGLGVGAVEQNTNMVFFAPEAGETAALGQALAAQGIAISAGGTGPIRLVLHRDVTDEALSMTCSAIRAHYS